MTDKIRDQIQEFLSERRLSDGGWAPVEQQDFWQLDDIIQSLISAKWGADADGDRPVEYTLIDRTLYTGTFFLPIRYMYDANKTELMSIMRDCMTNVSIAQSQLSTAIRMMLYLEGQNNE